MGKVKDEDSNYVFKELMENPIIYDLLNRFEA